MSMHSKKLSLVQLDFQRNNSKSSENAINDNASDNTRGYKLNDTFDSKLKFTETKLTTTAESKAIDKLHVKGVPVEQTAEIHPSPQETIKLNKLDMAINKLQCINRYTQLVISFLSTLSFLVGLVALIAIPFELGDIGLYMIWVLMELLLNILLTTHSCKYAKIRKTETKTIRIKDRVRFYIILGSTLLIVDAIILIVDRVSNIMEMAFMSSSKKHMNDLLYIAYYRCLLYFLAMSLLKCIGIGASIVINTYLFKQACKRNITDFIITTKDQFSKQ